jgi:hypothetical protein
MSPTLEELLARMRTLEEQLEQEYSQHREEFARRRAAMAEHFLELQRRQKVGLWPYLRQSRWPVLLSAPLVYSGWVAFALLDAFVSLYQAVCFPIHGIPKVGRADYLVFDRADLPYLNVVEKFNCFYCSYGNGVAAYAREVSAAPSSTGARSSTPGVCAMPIRAIRSSLNMATPKPSAPAWNACGRC